MRDAPLKRDAALMHDAVSPRRPMTPLNKLYGYYERMLWRVGMNANSCEWLEIEQPIDIAVLTAAARLVQMRHPVLRARTRLGAYWQVDPAVAAPEVHVATLDVAPGAPLTDVLMANVWRRRLLLDTGPAFRLHVTHLPGRTVLQIVTTHVYTDGRSANIVAADLVAAYDAVLNGSTFDTDPVDLLDRDLRKTFWQGLSARERRAAYAGAVRAMVRDARTACLKIVGKGHDRGMTEVVFRDLGTEALDNLRVASARHGMSRHPFYILAAARAIMAFNARRGVTDAKPLRIIDNVSLRPFGDAAMQALYELCAIPYTLVVDPAADDATILATARDGLRALRNGKALDEVARQYLLAIGAALGPKILGLKLVLATLIKSNVILSNVGPVDDAMFAGKGLRVIDYYSFSQLFPPGEVMIFVSTARGRLRFVCLYDSANFTRQEVEEELCADFIHTLAVIGAASSLGADPADGPNERVVADVR